MSLWAVSTEISSKQNHVIGSRSVSSKGVMCCEQVQDSLHLMCPDYLIYLPTCTGFQYKLRTCEQKIALGNKPKCHVVVDTAVSDALGPIP